MYRRTSRGQSSFELLLTLSFGLAILLPIVAVAFLQIATSNTSLATIEAQQAASKIASVSTFIGNEGAPAKQVAQVQIPPGVLNIYVGSLNGSIGHEIIFTVSSQSGTSYVTAYTPVNVSGEIGGLSLAGTYLLNISAQNICPRQQLQVPCVYIAPLVT
jgi:hypothetical protein